MIYGPEEKKIFESSKVCWLCEEKFVKSKDYKVRDHCHLTGKFRGAAHNNCNLKYKLPNFIPVIFHNLSGYDAHLFVKSLGVTEGEVKCIPNNEERYISFSKSITVDYYIDKSGKEKDTTGEIRFLDSFKFMASSLDKLVKNLNKDDLLTTKKVFSQDFELVCKKGVYPYEYMDCLEKLNVGELPPKDKYYSRLTNTGITDDDHAHAKKVWEHFKMNNHHEKTREGQ